MTLPSKVCFAQEFFTNKGSVVRQIGVEAFCIETCKKVVTLEIQLAFIPGHCQNSFALLPILVNCRKSLYRAVRIVRNSGLRPLICAHVRDACE